jgi:predicted ester cyclase
LIAEEEKVVARWRMEAINEGEIMGIAATGKRVSVSGINVYCIANCQLVEHWHEMDTFGLMQQPGVTS